MAGLPTPGQRLIRLLVRLGLMEYKTEQLDHERFSTAQPSSPWIVRAFAWLGVVDQPPSLLDADDYRDLSREVSAALNVAGIGCFGLLALGGYLGEALAWLF